MRKNILITGVADGIGLATARMLAQQNYNMFLHGRSLSKLEEIERNLLLLPGGA